MVHQSILKNEIGTFQKLSGSHLGFEGRDKVKSLK